MSRPNNKISRDTSFSSYSTEEPSWAKDYFEAVEKYSVKSRRDDSALFDQINQILTNTKSKYSSVEEAVLDMQKRTGLFDILQKLAAEETPKMFERFPDLKDFIEAKIKTYPGSSVTAICEHILQEPKYKDSLPAGEHIPSDVEEYINKLKGKMTPKDKNDVSDGKVNLDIDHTTEKANNPLNILSPTAF